jgi:hypothetical protein
MSTLVTYQQDGHSYPINPGSCWMGSILTTSSICALHRGHAITLLLRCLEGRVSTKIPQTESLLWSNALQAQWLQAK